MKDRKKVWDRRNIDKLEEEVRRFFDSNIERFKVVDKVGKKRKIKDIEEITPEQVVVKELDSTKITYESDSNKR